MHFNTRNISIPENSKEFSYLLGIAYSDGSVSNRSFSLELHKNDSDVIYKLEKWLKSVGLFPKISFRHDKYIRLRVHSVVLVEVLNRYGIMRNKTYLSESIPKAVYSDHFLRGFFDGDGGIQISKKRPNVTFYSNKEVILYQICELIEIEANIERKTIRRKSRAYSVTYYSHDAMSLLEYMYSDPIIYMDRKFTRYSNHIFVPDKRFWSEDDITYLKDNYIKQSDSWKRIAKSLGKTDKAVSCMISRLELNR